MRPELFQATFKRFSNAKSLNWLYIHIFRRSNAKNPKRRANHAPLYMIRMSENMKKIEKTQELCGFPLSETKSFSTENQMKAVLAEIAAKMS